MSPRRTKASTSNLRPDGVTHDVVSRPYDRVRLREEALADTSAIVVRRAEWVRFSRVPLRREEFPSEDWEFTWRCARFARAEHIPVVTVRYRFHDGSYFRDWRKIVPDDGGDPVVPEDAVSIEARGRLVAPLVAPRVAPIAPA